MQQTLSVCSLLINNQFFTLVIFYPKADIMIVLVAKKIMLRLHQTCTIRYFNNAKTIRCLYEVNELFARAIDEQFLVQVKKKNLLIQ